MNETKLREILAKASGNEAVELLQQPLRQSVRMALYDAMEQEANLLYGAKYKTSESEYKRAGSEQGKQEAIKRLRVRTPEREVPLETHKAASSQPNQFNEVVGYLEQGLSQRGAARVKAQLVECGMKRVSSSSMDYAQDP